MPTQTEMASLIKDVMGPMYDSGALSHRTYVSSAGLKSDVELEYKKDEKPAREDGLLDPPLSYVQKSIGGDGGETTTEQTKSEGRPTSQEEHKNKLEKIDKRAEANGVEDD
jgi:hypothetical protein